MSFLSSIPQMPISFVFLLLFVFLLPHYPAESAVGINYGQVADNLPTPDQVLPLLHSLGISRVKLYDSDPKVLRAFAGTGVEFVVGLPDNSVPRVTSTSSALSWVDDNLRPFLPKTNISAVTVGNEILAGNNTLLIKSLVPAMNSLHSALSSLGFDKIKVTTAHSLNILSSSYPPSAGEFRSDVLPYIIPLLDFLNKTASPFLINAYPFFAYKADPKKIQLDYVLFESNAGVIDPGSGLKYDNMLHAQVDAVQSAIKAAGGKHVEIIVSETGWPSQGDEDEFGSTPENAAKYNRNLLKMVTQGKGTPLSPDSALGVYVFAMFNENLKPGPGSERHYGLFNPDGTPAYDIGIKSGGLGNTNSTSSGGSGVNASGDTSTDELYIISAAPERWFLSGRAVAVTMVATVLGLI